MAVATTIACIVVILCLLFFWLGLWYFVDTTIENQWEKFCEMTKIKNKDMTGWEKF